MRLFIEFVTSYSYEAPPRSLVQVLRMTPRDTPSQQVLRWRVDVSADAKVQRGADSLGNLTETLYIDAPPHRIDLAVSGVVETADTSGVFTDPAERLPPQVYLRDTSLTAADPAIADLAADIQRTVPEPLERLHTLMARLHRDVAFQTGWTDACTSAAEAYALGRGVCQDLSHIFLSAARRMDIPARYVSGHFARTDGMVDQDAGHAWAEAYVPYLGWVAFDPANGICPAENHVRIAHGLDYLGAAPVRGARYGGQGERLTVRSHVSETQQQ